MIPIEEIDTVDQYGVAGTAPHEDQPRRRARLRPVAMREAALAVLAGFAMSLVLRTLFHWAGFMSTLVWVVVLSTAVFTLMSRGREGQVISADRIVTVVIWSVGVLAIGLLTWMLVFIFTKGLPGINWAFVTQDLSKVGPSDPGGGILHAIVGTLEQVAIATVLSVPVAILTAVYLHEIKGRFAPLIRFIVDAMTGLPSVVAGLLVYTTWVSVFGFSGLAAGLALTILMLPTVTRTAEEILRTIPDSLREASLALGSPQWRVVGKVVLPTARSGLVTAVILGVARAVGETAPAVLTAFGNSRLNTNAASGPQSSLPLEIWNLLKSGNEAQTQRAWAGSVVLITLVLVLFVLARVVAARGNSKVKR